jgi:Gpi18-like mannosyltransferase
MKKVKEIFIKNKHLLGVFLFWLLALFLIGVFSENASTYQNRKCSVKYYNSFYRWDSSWYTKIAKNGYSFSAEKNSSIAYWPLYPLTIKIAVNSGLINYKKVSTFLSIVYAFLAFIFLYKLLLFDYSKRISFYVACCFLFFPTAYFFIAGYPESLFAMLVILSFYFARKEKWLLAGIFGTLLALTKPYGVCIIIPMLYEYYLSSGKKWKIFFHNFSWIPLIFPIGSVLGFMLFNYLKFGNALAFLITQQSWGRKIGNPFAALFFEAKDYVTPFEKLFTGTGIPYIFYVFFFGFFLWSLYISRKSVRKSYLIFTVLVMFAAFMTGTLTSWGRYMMISVGSLIGPAIYFYQKKYLKFLYIIFFALLLFSMASFFVRCYPFE